MSRFGDQSISYQMESWTRTAIRERLNFLLALMGSSKKNATTHAQRNHYEAVVRIELEQLLADVAYIPSANTDNDLPF